MLHKKERMERREGGEEGLRGSRDVGGGDLMGEVRRGEGRGL
jgi:hypothetical protein